MFKTKYTNTISTWYPYNSTSSISPTIAPAPDKGSSFPKWASAIIGVILGFLFISAAAIFWFLRRRHKLRESQSTGDRSTRSWILRWLHTSGSATGVPKSGDTTAPTGYSVFTNESTITPATAVSPQSVEAGSDPVYEMLGQFFNLLFLTPLTTAKVMLRHSLWNFPRRTTIIPSPVQFRPLAFRVRTMYLLSRLARPVQRMKRARLDRLIIATCLVCLVCRL